MAEKSLVPHQDGGSQIVPYDLAPNQGPNSRSMGFATTLRTGLIVVLIFVCGFGAWAGLAPLESAAIAVGEIVVEGDRRKVEHFEGGIVGEILVRDGDTVKPGAPLIRLDDTQAKASVGVLNTRMTLAVALEARLIACFERRANARPIAPRIPVLHSKITMNVFQRSGSVSEWLADNYH